MSKRSALKAWKNEKLDARSDLEKLMNRLRLIPRLDIKGPNLVKPICFEGLRVIGNPAEFANKYYFDGADELLFIDIVASLYQRNQFLNIISTVAQKVFIPIIVFCKTPSLVSSRYISI